MEIVVWFLRILVMDLPSSPRKELKSKEVLSCFFPVLAQILHFIENFHPTLTVQSLHIFSKICESSDEVANQIVEETNLVEPLLSLLREP